MRLTDIAVQNLQAPEKGAKIYICDQLDGFGVRVSQGGTKSFVLTYGRHRERVTIGRYPIISLKEARAEARRRLAERTLGRHRPIRLEAADALSRYMREQEEKNRPSTVRDTAGLLRNHFPKVWKRWLEDISTNDITVVTDKLLVTGQPGAANHAHAAMRGFLRWCVKRRYLQHSPLEGVDLPSKIGRRERVLADEELRALLMAAQKAGIYGTFLQLLIYTGQRRGEIAALDAAWLDHRAQTISIPGRIAKNGRTHTFPYGDAVSFLLSELPVEGLLLRPRWGERPMSGFSKMKRAFDKQCPMAPWTLHDLRRTFATGMQRLGIRIEVTEALLNHVSGSRSGIVSVYQQYGYHEEMRVAMMRWEAHIALLLGDGGSRDVAIVDHAAYTASHSDFSTADHISS